MTDQKTAQITLAANAARDEAFGLAVRRIELYMLPGARALAGTRTPSSDYWIDREHDLTGTAPFRGRTVLIWRDHGRSQSNTKPVEPYDHEHASYETQVVVPRDATPMELAELARLAILLTAEIVRISNLTIAAQVAALDSERIGFDEVARDVAD